LQEVEAPTFSDIRLRDGGKPYAPAAFCPQEDSWYSFLLEAESEGLGKLKKSTSSTARTGNLLACNIVPQSTTPPLVPKFTCSEENYYGQISLQAS
jgi:hypothetical protein